MAPSVIVVGGGRVGTYLACKLRQAGGRVILKGAKPGTVPPCALQNTVTKGGVPVTYRKEEKKEGRGVLDITLYLQHYTVVLFCFSV